MRYKIIPSLIISIFLIFLTFSIAVANIEDLQAEELVSQEGFMDIVSEESRESQPIIIQLKEEPVMNPTLEAKKNQYRTMLKGADPEELPIFKEQSKFKKRLANKEIVSKDKGL